MAKKLKYKKYDENGLLIVERARSYYIALDEETGKKTKVFTKARKSKNEGHNVANILNHPKAGSNGFKQNPQNIYTGNVGSRITKERKEKRESGVLWKESQRECLRVMLTMERTELLLYLVQWHMASSAIVMNKYGVNVDAEDMSKLDQSEPTMIQTTCLQMVLHAQDNAKFGLSLLELLEGKAVSQLVLNEKQDQKDATKAKATETRTDLELVLDKLKSEILDEPEQEEQVEAVNVPKQEDKNTEQEVFPEKLFEKEESIDPMAMLDWLSGDTNE